MELHFGDKPLKVPAPNVPAKLSDGSDSDQEAVNGALFQSIQDLEAEDNLAAPVTWGQLCDK